MDKTEFSASARPYPEIDEEQSHVLLLDAAKDALEWLRRFQKHAPREAMFGGEERIARRLSEAVRLSPFEVRDRPGCDDGNGRGPTARPTERPTPTPCLGCGSSGRVRVFVYGGPRSRR